MAELWGSVVAHCLASPGKGKEGSQALSHVSQLSMGRTPGVALGMSMPAKVASDQVYICHSAILPLSPEGNPGICSSQNSITDRLDSCHGFH